MLPSDESIMAAIYLAQNPSVINHQWLYFLPNENSLRSIEVDLATDKNFHWYKSPLSMHDTYVEGNMANLLETISINIFSKPRVVENFFIRVYCKPDEIKIYTTLFKEYHDIIACNYEEMIGIDPWIVEHKIKMYLNKKLVGQKLRAVNPKKSPTIKDEIEKLLRESFIYPVWLTEWESNPILVNKKHAAIHVCTDLHDLNKAC